MNQSVVIRQSLTLSWKGTLTAQERSQAYTFLFTRFPQRDSSAVVQTIGGFGFGVASLVLVPFRLTSLAPRIDFPQSASAAEPAITIQNVTKQDEGFYRIEVFVGFGRAAVANHTIFLTVFGNYVHFTCHVNVAR